MDKLLLMLAEAMPEDVLLDKLVDDIKEYKLTGNEDTRKHIRMNCALMMAKDMVEKEGFDNVSEAFDKHTKIHGLFDVDDN